MALSVLLYSWATRTNDSLRQKDENFTRMLHETSLRSSSVDIFSCATICLLSRKPSFKEKCKREKENILLLMMYLNLYGYHFNLLEYQYIKRQCIHVVQNHFKYYLKIFILAPKQALLIFDLRVKAKKRYFTIT